MAMEEKAPAAAGGRAICTISAIQYMWLPTQLKCERLVCEGPVAHHTTSPSAAMISVVGPIRPPLVTRNPLSCMAAFMMVTVGFGTLLGTAPVMKVKSWLVQLPEGACSVMWYV